MTSSQQPLNLSESRAGPQSSASPPDTAQINDSRNAVSAATRQVSSALGLACDACRKRKLKCDRLRPMCSSCLRTATGCRYETVRKRTGPRKGHLKHLYDRLAHMEALLQSPTGTTEEAALDLVTMEDEKKTSLSSSTSVSASGADISRTAKQMSQPSTEVSPSTSTEPISHLTSDIYALDVDDVVPSVELTNELDEIFFRNTYQTLPIFNKQKFMASRNQNLNSDHVKGLRYAMWALAAGSLEQYAHLQQEFYRKARKSLLAHEDNATGEIFPTLEQCQAWLMVTMYEFKKLNMPVAWISVGRTVRLAQMLSLQRLDIKASETAETYLPPTQDLIDREERRRTFWMVYWADQMASMGLGWPSSIREADITTNLPDFEDAFQTGQLRCTPSFGDILSAKVRDFSSVAGYSVVNVVIGRILNHLYHPREDDQKDDVKGNFWKRHREIDNILLELGIRMPVHLRINQGYGNSLVMMHNTHFRVATLVLHQAAILHASTYNLPARIVEDSTIRSLSAAAEITTCMRAVAHLDLSTMNAFMAYGAYVASKVFLHALEEQGHDHEMLYAIKFLYEMLEAFARSGTNAFLYRTQLDHDIRRTFTDCDGHRVSVRSQLWGSEDTSSLPDSATMSETEGFTNAKKLFDPFIVLMIRDKSSNSSEAGSPMKSLEATEQVRINNGQVQTSERLQPPPSSVGTYSTGPDISHYGNGIDGIVPGIPASVLPSSVETRPSTHFQEQQAGGQLATQRFATSTQLYPWPAMHHEQHTNQASLSDSAAYSAEQPWFMPSLGPWATELLELHNQHEFDWTEALPNQYGMSQQ